MSEINKQVDAIVQQKLKYWAKVVSETGMGATLLSTIDNFDWGSFFRRLHS